jgi:hypothetical protein
MQIFFLSKKRSRTTNGCMAYQELTLQGKSPTLCSVGRRFSMWVHVSRWLARLAFILSSASTRVLVNGVAGDSRMLVG